MCEDGAHRKKGFSFYLEQFNVFGKKMLLRTILRACCFRVPSDLGPIQVTCLGPKLSDIYPGF